PLAPYPQQLPTPISVAPGRTHPLQKGSNKELLTSSRILKPDLLGFFYAQTPRSFENTHTRDSSCQSPLNRNQHFTHTHTRTHTHTHSEGELAHLVLEQKPKLYTAPRATSREKKFQSISDRLQ